MKGATRSSRWYFAPPPGLPRQEIAAGVWHHIALDAGEDLPAWRGYANAGPVPFTPVYDHYFFDSCYSLSPGGLVELCSYGPGLLLDQELDELGQTLALSKRTEPLRARLERELTPLTNPRDPHGVLIAPSRVATAGT